jgi:hypothetical protein
MSLSDVLYVASRYAAESSSAPQSQTDRSNEVVSGVLLQRRTLGVAMEKVKLFLNDPLISASVKTALLACRRIEHNEQQVAVSLPPGELIVDRATLR